MGNLSKDAQCTTRLCIFDRTVPIANDVCMNQVRTRKRVESFHLQWKKQLASAKEIKFKNRDGMPRQNGFSEAKRKVRYDQRKSRKIDDAFIEMK